MKNYWYSPLCGSNRNALGTGIAEGGLVAGNNFEMWQLVTKLKTGGNARWPSEWIIVVKKVDMSDFICTKPQKYFPQGQCVASGCRDDNCQLRRIFNLYLPGNFATHYSVGITFDTASGDQWLTATTGNETQDRWEFQVTIRMNFSQKSGYVRFHLLQNLEDFAPKVNVLPVVVQTIISSCSRNSIYICESLQCCCSSVGITFDTQAASGHRRWLTEIVFF